MEDAAAVQTNEQNRAQAFADNLRAQFGFDFVAISLARYDSAAAQPDEEGRAGTEGASSDLLSDWAHEVNQKFLTWDCVSGNQTDRYRRIFLPSGVGVLGEVSALKRPLIVRNAAHDIAHGSWYQFPIVAAESLTSFIATPLMQEDKVRVIVLCAYREEHAIDDDLLNEVEDWVARDTGLEVSPHPPYVMHAQNATPVHAEVAHRILRAQEDERQRIARELHDGLGQELLLVQIALRSYKYVSAEEKDAAVEQAQAQLKEAIAHVSTIAHDLRPETLDELGLSRAIRAECRKLERGFGVSIDADGVEDLEGLNPDCQMALYRIFQEAVTNACKYSGSSRLQVSLGRRGGASLAGESASAATRSNLQQSPTFAVLEVRDYGCGFDAEHPEIQGGGLGLVGMRERAAAFEGRVDITSQPGFGTLVRATVPLGDAAAPTAGVPESGADR